jgi:membrane protein DedA with SNARE-associated domain
VDFLLTQVAQHAHGIVAYAAIFGVLVACGMGLPLPEDVSLITGGFLTHQGQAYLPLMMAVGFVGIIAGDSIIFAAGRRLGAKVGTKQTGFFARIVTPAKRARVEGLFHAHGQKIVMAARFLPGVRAVTFFTAGSAGMKYRWFILWDGLAALVSAPLLVFLGFYFGDELALVIRKVREGQIRVIAVIVIGAAAYIAYSRWRNKRNKDQGTDDSSEPPAGTNGSNGSPPSANGRDGEWSSELSPPPASASTGRDADRAAP